MGAKIYDSTSASWKDAETPKIHNGTTFADAVGKVYDSSTQSWKDAWSNLHILIQDGVAVNELAGTGWTNAYPSTPYAAPVQQSGYIQMPSNLTSNYNNRPRTTKVMMTSANYKYLLCKVQAQAADYQGWNSSVVIYNESTIVTSIVIHRSMDGYPTVGSFNIQYLAHDISSISVNTYLGFSAYLEYIYLYDVALSNTVPGGYEIR